MIFKCTTSGPDTLGLAPMLERFADDQRVPAHCTPEQAAWIVPDQFKRRIAHDLELIELRAEPEPPVPFA